MKYPWIDWWKAITKLRPLIMPTCCPNHICGSICRYIKTLTTVKPSQVLMWKPGSTCDSLPGLVIRLRWCGPLMQVPKTWAEVELELRKLSKVDFPGIFHFKKHLQNHKSTQQNTKKKQFEILDVQRSEILSLYSSDSLPLYIQIFFQKKWLWHTLPAAQHCMAMSWSKCNLHQTLPFTASKRGEKSRSTVGDGDLLRKMRMESKWPQKNLLPNGGGKMVGYHGTQWKITLKILKQKYKGPTQKPADFASHNTMNFHLRLEGFGCIWTGLTMSVS